MNLSITPEIHRLIQNKIDSGMYSNATEVVADALRRMDEYDDWRELREFFTPRIASARAGNIISESFDSIIAEAKAKK